MRKGKEAGGKIESQSHTSSIHTPLPLRAEGGLGHRNDTDREILSTQSPVAACYLTSSAKVGVYAVLGC